MNGITGCGIAQGWWGVSEINDGQVLLSMSSQSNKGGRHVNRSLLERVISAQTDKHPRRICVMLENICSRISRILVGLFSAT